MAGKKENTYNISGFFLKINQLIWRKSFLQNIRSVFYFVDSILLLFCKKAKYEQGKKKKVLLVYNMALGDGIMFYGVSKSIREIWPEEEYEISIACQSAFKSLYEASGIYDKVLPFDFSGSVVNLKKRKQLFTKLREVYYDIVVDPVGCEDCTTNIFVTRAVLGKEKYGALDIAMEHNQTPEWMRKKIYTKIVRINVKRIHLIQYYAEFFKALGAKNCVARPAYLPEVQLDLDLPEKFFIVFPVASMAVKKWNLENYAYVTEQIYKKTGMPLLVCGTNHDKETIDQFVSLLKDVEVIDAIGKTNIIQFTQLIGKAALVVSNDTSAYHIAVARQVPVAMICGGYTYDRYAHYDYESEGCKNPVLVCHKMECYNCNNHCIHSDFKVFPCIESITKEDAWKQVNEMIEKEGI